MKSDHITWLRAKSKAVLKYSAEGQQLIMTINSLINATNPSILSEEPRGSCQWVGTFTHYNGLLQLISQQKGKKQ